MFRLDIQWNNRGIVRHIRICVFGYKFQSSSFFLLMISDNFDLLEMCFFVFRMDISLSDIFV